MAKKKDLPATPIELQGRAAVFFDVIRTESDRGYVLVAASFVDESLEMLLRARMSDSQDVVKKTIDPLFTGVGTLRSFGAKIELCRALKLITEKEYADINAIRELRNHFAHSYVNATFNDEKAMKIIAKLKHFGTDAFPFTDAERDRPSALRHRFGLAASWLAGSVHSKGGATSNKLSIS